MTVKQNARRPLKYIAFFAVFLAIGWSVFSPIVRADNPSAQKETAQQAEKQATPAKVTASSDVSPAQAVSQNEKPLGNASVSESPAGLKGKEGRQPVNLHSTEVKTSVQSLSAPTITVSLLQPILALITVFGIMFAIVWVLKKGKMIHTMPKGLLKQIAMLPLSSKESIRVVECADTWLVLGVTTHQITLLHTLTKEALPLFPEEKKHDIPFKDWLDDKLSRLKKSS